MPRRLVIGLSISWCLALSAPAGALAAITFQSADVARLTSCANTITITTPRDLAPGDLMLAYLVVSPTWQRDVAAPPGWTMLTQVADEPNLPTWLFYKVAEPLESPAYTWAFAFDECWAGLALSVYRGVDPAGPIDGFAGQENPPSDLQPIPEITTTVDGAMLVAYYALDWPGTSWTPPEGMTEDVDASTGDASFGSAHAIQAFAGPTGARVAVSSPWSSTGAGLLVALRPGQDSTPLVFITSPTDGTIVARRSIVNIGVTVLVSAVLWVEVYVDDKLLCRETVAPYMCAWKVPSPPNRNYRLQARAYDTSDSVTISTPDWVTSSSQERPPN